MTMGRNDRKPKLKETSNKVGKVEAATARKFDVISSEKCTKETDVDGKQECDLRMQKVNRGEECKMEVSPASKPDVTFTPLSFKLCNENDGKNEKEIVEIPSSYCSGKEERDMKKPPAKDVAPAAIVIDDDCSTPKHHVCPDDPQSKLTILEATKNNILDKTGWLYDTEINAGQILLKKQFPLVDGLRDPAIKGHLVDPARSEFMQIINVGRHWLCLTTIGVSCPGIVRVFDSLFSKPNAITCEHACRMLLHTGDAVTFINERVQKQIGSADWSFCLSICHISVPRF